MSCWNIKSEELEASDRLGEIESKVRELRSQRSLGKQEFLTDAQELFQPITKFVGLSSRKLLEQSKVAI